MAKYVVFFSYTPDTWTKMIANPEDRGAALKQGAQAVGGDVDVAYYMFGDKDGMVIVEAPDSATAAGISLAATSTGAFTSVETHELIPTADLPAVLEGASRVKGSYRPPGG